MPVFMAFSRLQGPFAAAAQQTAGSALGHWLAAGWLPEQLLLAVDALLAQLSDPSAEDLDPRRLRLMVRSHSWLSEPASPVALTRDSSVAEQAAEGGRRRVLQQQAGRLHLP